MASGPRSGAGPSSHGAGGIGHARSSGATRLSRPYPGPSSGTISMNPRYALVASRASHRCEYCHAPESVFNFAFEVEHVIPPSRGGADAESNWALACRACNLHKGSHVHSLDPESQADVRLFHPRQDQWQEHLRADVEAGMIVGSTPVGRATVNCLAMNSAAQVAARRQWMRLGLFPWTAARYCVTPRFHLLPGPQPALDHRVDLLLRRQADERVVVAGVHGQPRRLAEGD